MRGRSIACDLLVEGRMSHVLRSPLLYVRSNARTCLVGVDDCVRHDPTRVYPLLVAHVSWKSCHPFRKLRPELEFKILLRENSDSLRMDQRESSRFFERTWNFEGAGKDSELNQKSLPPQNTRTDFSQLAESIRAIDVQLKSNVAKAVNLSLTLRNWLIGFYIHEYEQHGNDRAQYGDRLIESLASQLGNLEVSRSEARELRRYRLFYQTYPQIWETLSPEFRNLLPVNQLQSAATMGDSPSPPGAPHYVC